MPYVPPPLHTAYKRLADNRVFERAVRRAAAIKREIDELKSELDDINDNTIEPQLLAARVGLNNTIEVEGIARLRVADVASGSKIDATLLLRNGVTRKVIDASTVENARRHYVQIDILDEKGRTKAQATNAAKTKTTTETVTETAPRQPRNASKRK